jgi:hypothetical protein
MLPATTRLVVAVIATLTLIGGMAVLAIGPAGLYGLWLVIGSAVVLVALAIERNRYRSEEAERSFESTGPGGGEPAGGLEPRFRRTDELFVDPTTGTTMRVFLDGRTGERRYVAEG